MRRLFPLIILLGLASCGSPDESETVEDAPEPEIVVEANAEIESGEETSSEPEEETQAALEPEQPELRVFIEGERIVVEGAIRSFRQHDRILAQLDEMIPDLGVDDRLEVETHRWGVGWGNRATEGFLVPYFLEVEDPYFEYREGTVILKGKTSEKLKKDYHQLAVVIFTGPLSQDLDNQIVTE